jgi:hypothetical protein
VALSPETLLMGVIVAFFLKDSTRMLHPNEAVLVRGVGGRWRAGFGARSWRLGGREPHLANPFLPHEPVVRLAWQMAAPQTEAGALPFTLPDALPRLGALAWAIWAQLFVLLPAALTGQIALLAPAAVIAMLYASAVLAMAIVWWHRRALGLSDRSVCGLAFECIVCPPYAANLVRRVAALQPARDDFIAAARRLLDAAQQRAVARECLARIDERIEAEPSEGATMAALQLGRARFVQEASDERR